MADEINYVTPAGFKSLQDEYNHLKREERPQVVDTVAWAASNGDRSENADYHYGKKRLREIDRRLRFLTSQLNTAEIIDPRNIHSEKIEFGATVTILDEDGNQKLYAIVGVEESDPAAGKISYRSPLARALDRATVGDYVCFASPQGEREVEVLSVEYKEIV